MKRQHERDAEWRGHEDPAITLLRLYENLMKERPRQK